MFTCTIEMYGVSPSVTELTRAEVDLSKGAPIQELVAALKAKIPALEGPVIQSGFNRLTEAYAFIVNGQFHFGESETRIQKGDRVVLVLLAFGGQATHDGRPERYHPPRTLSFNFLSC
jgi:hypothetical protein